MKRKSRFVKPSFILKAMYSVQKESVGTWRPIACQATSRRHLISAKSSNGSWRKPGAVIVPPANDAHMAHRATRALAAIGLVGAKLTDCLVLTGWTPWGPLAEPNAYFPYDGEAERTKEWAIHCHASQVLLTDYTQYCSHLGRAYAALVREWAEGHSLAGRAHRTDDRFVGVELFQIDTYDPRKAKSYPPDPIQIALGILSGEITIDASNEASPTPAVVSGSTSKSAAVAHL